MMAGQSSRTFLNGCPGFTGTHHAIHHTVCVYQHQSEGERNQRERSRLSHDSILAGDCCRSAVETIHPLEVRLALCTMVQTYTRSMEGLTTARLAHEGGVNVETIRYYERHGLLPKPPRTHSG